MHLKYDLANALKYNIVFLDLSFSPYLKWCLVICPYWHCMKVEKKWTQQENVSRVKRLKFQERYNGCWENVGFLIIILWLLNITSFYGTIRTVFSTKKNKNITNCCLQVNLFTAVPGATMTGNVRWVNTSC